VHPLICKPPPDNKEINKMEQNISMEAALPEKGGDNDKKR